MDGVISVIPNHILKLHTTRSWDFMGFSQGKLGASQEEDVIIGLLDSGLNSILVWITILNNTRTYANMKLFNVFIIAGIWPESESFNDEGMSAPPAKWNGTCQGANFTCNK